MSKIIQFIHPGTEHSFDSRKGADLHKNWNSLEHRRKFLQSEGQYIEATGLNKQGCFKFWGEWEAPSIVERTGLQKPMPEFLHAPYIPVDVKGNIIISGTQNTDPCVFGEYFKYFLCKQIRKDGSLTQMANLNEGDMILFGACKNNRFLLDTVFIVDEVICLDGIEEEYKNISVDRYSNYAKTGCKIYKGKTFCGNIDGCFSFTPASLNYFKRIELPHRLTPQVNKYITANLSQGLKGVNLIINKSEVLKICKEIKDLCFASGCVLAYKIKWPQREI
jgi:hypothetical protein